MKIFVMMLFLCSFSIGFAQETELKTEAEIRVLIKKYSNKDYKVAEEARKALRELDAKYLPILFRLVKQGKPCEQIEVAELIVDIEPKNKEIIPILIKLARGASLSSLFNAKEESLCRRRAAFMLAFSVVGIRELDDMLQNGDTWEKHSAIYAFDDLTKTTDYSEDILQVIKEGIPAIGALTTSKDDILRDMSNEVLRRIVRRGVKELAEIAKKYVKE